MDRSDLELAELAGGFIHELKNHLGTLALNLELLGEDFAEPQNHRERRAAERIKRLSGECARLVALSSDFLQFARIHDIELHPERLDLVVEELIDFIRPTAREAGVRIHCYLPADLPMIQLNRDLFKQTLLNLILNAEQAMPDGGELTLQAGQTTAGIYLHVIDTGNGIPPEMMPKLFQAFQTSKPNGNGLGLLTARRIVRAHGGELEVSSEVGRGTRFTIWLPVS